MSFEPREYLRHIATEAIYLEQATAGVSRAAFLDDPTLQRACVRSLEIIGEATKKIPGPLRAQHPEVAWRAMAGMRDRLTNPPFHIGKATTLAVPAQFLRDAKAVLVPGVKLFVVANRTLPYEPIMMELFGNLRTVHNGRRFKVLTSTSPVPR